VAADSPFATDAAARRAPLPAVRRPDHCDGWQSLRRHDHYPVGAV